MNFRKDMRTNESKNKINEIKTLDKKIKRKDLRYETKKINIWLSAICNNKILWWNKYAREASIVETEENLSNLLKNPAKCNKKYRPITNEGKEKKRDIYESV